MPELLGTIVTTANQTRCFILWWMTHNANWIPHLITSHLRILGRGGTWKTERRTQEQMQRSQGPWVLKFYRHFHWQLSKKRLARPEDYSLWKGLLKSLTSGGLLGTWIWRGFPHSLNNKGGSCRLLNWSCKQVGLCWDGFSFWVLVCARQSVWQRPW